jgi:hypothetical protein
MPPGIQRRPTFSVPPLDVVNDPPRVRVTDDEQLHIARTDAAIPDCFRVCPAGCAWSNSVTSCKHCGARLVYMTWTLLAGLVGRSGYAAVVGVETIDGDLLKGAEAVAEIQRRMSASEQIVLLGASRVGKSVSAAAFAHEEIRAGAEKVRWLNPFTLGDFAVDRALGARTVIIDDLGEEMATAESGTGISAFRAEGIGEIIAALARTRGKCIVVTTFLERKRMANLYGGGVMARVYDGADVIRLRE